MAHGAHLDADLAIHRGVFDEVDRHMHHSVGIHHIALVAAGFLRAVIDEHPRHELAHIDVVCGSIGVCALKRTDDEMRVPLRRNNCGRAADERGVACGVHDVIGRLEDQIAKALLLHLCLDAGAEPVLIALGQHRMQALFHFIHHGIVLLSFYFGVPGYPERQTPFFYGSYYCSPLTARRFSPAARSLSPKNTQMAAQTAK